MTYTPRDLRILLLDRGLKQRDVADRLSMDYGQLNQVLNGRRPMPQGFAESFVAAVDAAAAEKAAKLMGEPAGVA